MRSPVRTSLLLPALVFSGIVVAQDRHPADVLALDSHIAWLDDGAAFRDGGRTKRALTEEEDALDRGAFLDGAIARSKTEGKLVFLYVPRIIEESSRGRQMYRAPVLDVYMRQVIFCDADVTKLLEEHFVPVRMTLDEELCDRFSFRPLKSVEPAVIFLDGDGEVVHYIERIRTFDAMWFANLMRNVLAKAEPAAVEASAPNEDGVDGLLAAAAYLRRLRRPALALAKLDAAHALLAAEEAQWRESLGDQRPSRDDPNRARLRTARNEIELERGRLHTLTGNSLEALAPLGSAFRGGSAEAGYLLALNRLALCDETGAMSQFQVVAQRYPDTMYGRRAIANVTMGLDDRPLGAAAAGFEHMGYLPEAAYEGLPVDTTWNGPPPTREEMIERGVRFLLSQQRGDGGFTESRYAYWGSSAITTNTWVAISALACSALIENRGALGADGMQRIDEALQDGEDFLFDPIHLNRGSNEDVYADAYRLVYLTRVVRRRPQDSQWALERAAEIIAAAAERQGGEGFFAHEYRNAFCTGAMLWSLFEARDVGAQVPDAVIDAGARALLSARYENGAYSYGGSARAGTGSLKDACGRMPMCEAVLLRAGQGQRGRLAFAMDNYWTYFDRLEQVRRNDFHSDGELAGFFFFHDFFHTSEVLRHLPDEVAAPMKQRFFEILQDIPELDGSFVDSHEFGRSYGTAMALLTLGNL
ncbi:MAG: hypothetical protein GY711_02100 [bacterium]|nr:hypothetical protein [bacterium]